MPGGATSNSARERLGRTSLRGGRAEPPEINEPEGETELSPEAEAQIDKANAESIADFENSTSAEL